MSKLTVFLFALCIGCNAKPSAKGQFIFVELPESADDGLDGSEGVGGQGGESGEDGESGQDGQGGEGGQGVGLVAEECGNGRIDGVEQCDAGRGNGHDGFGCRVDCTYPVCGDGHRAPGEYCDDGNLESGDGCDKTCKTEVDLLEFQEDPGATYRVVDPDESDVLHTSEHFVLRWNQDDNVRLSPEKIRSALALLEEIWSRYVDELGFYAPYTGSETKYKVNIWVSDRGWATGSGRNDMTTPGEHPAMWLHYNAAQDRGTLAHEFAHTLQYGSKGMRDSPFVGWFWESHAEFMRHQFFRDEVGCSVALVNSPHLYYGSTRNRYCNWQFTEYLAQTFSLKVVNHIWASSLRATDRCADLESPFTALLRVMGWNTAQLNDLFGLWAMANVGWDYPENGDVYREQYGAYHRLAPGQRGRLTRLVALDEEARRYISPDYLAPQRWGYNLTRLVPEQGATEVKVDFRGVVQTKPARGDFSAQKYLNEPGGAMSRPDSGWRWGLVAVTDQGAVRYSPLQAGARASLRFNIESGDTDLYLVVVGAPRTVHQVFWDQIYYSLYRYPWRVQVQGAYADGFQPSVESSPSSAGGRIHPNGGGFVGDEATVAESAFVGPRARVLGRAQILGEARVEGWAVVQDDARVKDRAVVSGHAVLAGSAVLSDDARVGESAQVYAGRFLNRAFVGGITWINEDVRIFGDAKIRSVSAARSLARGTKIYGTAQLLGDLEYHVRLLYSGVFYGFVSDDAADDIAQGHDRVAPEPEVTASLVGVDWDTDNSDCRSAHRGCTEGEGCVLDGGAYVCKVGATGGLGPRPTALERCLSQP